MSYQYRVTMIGWRGNKFRVTVAAFDPTHAKARAEREHGGLTTENGGVPQNMAVSARRITR